MSDENYTVRINRREGIVEIGGPDKDWIAAQLERLSVVFEQSVPSGSVDQEDPADRNGGGGKPEPATKPRRRRSSVARVAKSDLADDLTPDVMRQMHRYFEERPKATASHQNRAAVIATFLADEHDADGFSAGDLIAVYRAMGWPPPKNPNAVIKNATDRNHYFGGMRDGRVHLTPTGEHFGRHGSKERDERS